MTDRASTVLRRFGWTIYAPTTLYSLGQGAVVPLIPVIATRLGADLAVAAAVSALLIIGQLCGNIPAGWVIARVGERATMALASALCLVGVTGVVLTESIPVLAVAVFVIGFCTAAFGLGRITYMTMHVPIAFRARALSTLGGFFRLGMFTGPFVAAGLLAVFGNEDAPFYFFAGCLVVVIALVLLISDPMVASLPRPEAGSKVERTGVLQTAWTHRGVLARLGFGAATLSAIRSGRTILLPLWGVSLGVDATTIALVVGIAGSLEFALFYASGQVMDRYGRLWAALPAMLLMSIGFLALSFTHDLSTAVFWYVALSMLVGVGNGLSSGVLMTLGADLAPRPDPSAFLGAWRTLTDAGGASTPLIVAAVTAVSSLSIATGLIGLVGLLGAAAFVRWIPRYVPVVTEPTRSET